MVFQFQNVILFNKIGLKATEFWFFQKLAPQHYHQVTVGLKNHLRFFSSWEFEKLRITFEAGLKNMDS